jgi:hypothetical protein
MLENAPDEDAQPRRQLKWLMPTILIALAFFCAGVAFSDFEDGSMILNRAMDLVSGSPKTCKSLKKIVLDVGSYGIGNRMLAISSAAVFAAMTNRVLEVKWERTPSCRKSFDELFTPKSSAVSSLQPFIFNANTQKVATVKVTTKSCKVHINEEEEYIHFHFITDKELYERLDTECDVIYMKANNYFAHFLLGEQFGELSRDFRKIFDRPFNDISNILFKPDKHIIDKASEVRKMLSAGNKRWLSIQAHDMSKQGKLKHLDYESIEQAFHCANKLLKDKDIDYVFLATDSAKLEEYAYSLISDQKAYVLVGKSQQQNVLADFDAFSRLGQSEMDYALLDWYLVGEADYCMSPSIEQSAYSKTAVARGSCKYLDYQTGSSCDASAFLVNKEILLHTTRGGAKLEQFWEKKSHIDADKVWDTVSTVSGTVDEQCLDSKFSIDAIVEYWTL